jgi:hypothetical protein
MSFTPEAQRKLAGGGAQRNHRKRVEVYSQPRRSCQMAHRSWFFEIFVVFNAHGFIALGQDITFFCGGRSAFNQIDQRRSRLCPAIG